MPTVKPPSFFRSRVFVLLTGICVSLAGTFFLPARPAPAATIVLDPGHGGNDSGAGNHGEFTEKRFTLTLAQQVAGRLAARHRVALTRTADVTTAPEDRAAVANHLKADLMISLHLAVAPYCGDRTAAVYFHNDERLTIPPELTIPGTTNAPGTDRPAWATLQTRHRHQSQHLAATLKQALIDTGAADTVTVSGAPLVALMGADLPAVLLEVGCVHPAVALTSQQFNQQLNDIAEPIAAAIETAVKELLR
ncbi:hypothetical protein DSCA_49150 [Desulfosarcina alkanivorans]|uniref:N-acetylmuramoyl-L-alanine amidase n=1 Tax=Desulfosarcina alkanivorans TaxID=571177 RepID=A0A5K7YRM4_9BACT|nr:N-acetylmuramoyl-L-alanine amidase [Desulfosarcina alkanivorans]BBO70985.1 hypothetical protein DSCA_49150 [Desulfosarcina alkanivorans]